MLQEFLEVLLALDDGGGSESEIAEMTGMRPGEVRRRLEQLERSRFIERGTRPGPGGWGLTQEGRRVLRLSFDEYFKRVLYQKLGADKANVAA